MSDVLTLRPCTLKQANEFVEQLHRHHKKAQGHRFSIAVFSGPNLCGVAIVGRPVSASVDAYTVAEVTRLCTDGTRNACSILYAAVARACTAMGYDSVQTYILPSEGGASLRAAGWSLLGMSSGHSWTTTKRQRNSDADGVVKERWGRVLNSKNRPDAARGPKETT